MTADELKQSFFDKARDLLRRNVGQAATELLEWQATGLLTEGVVRQAAWALRHLSPPDALRMAEKLARDAALEVAARHDPVHLDAVAVVPREPSEAVVRRGVEKANGFASAGNRACNAYRAMIEAAEMELLTR